MTSFSRVRPGLFRAVVGGPNASFDDGFWAAGMLLAWLRAP
jgi:hypothetical protein